jgi:hypothetical protein
VQIGLVEGFSDAVSDIRGFPGTVGTCDQAYDCGDGEQSHDGFRVHFFSLKNNGAQG